MKEKELYLPLNHEWFVAFKEGDKPVEYREITAHWTRRLMEPTDEWPRDKHWDDLLGSDGRETLLANIRGCLGMGFIRFREWGDMVLTDGYPKKEDDSRHYVYRLHTLKAIREARTA